MSLCFDTTMNYGTIRGIGLKEEVLTPRGWQSTFGRDVRSSINLHSGRQFWPLQPFFGDILVEDIGWGLAHEARFGGQAAFHYSVAQHSVVLSQVVPGHLAKWALLHDASEGLGLKDMPRPIKQFMPEYKEHEHRLMSVIALQFGLLPAVEPDELKPYDHHMGHAEMVVLFPQMGPAKLRMCGYSQEEIDSLRDYSKLVESITPEVAYQRWMDRYTELFEAE